MLFLDRFSIVRNFRFVISVGISPVSWLRLRSSTVSDSQWLSSPGTPAVSALALKLSKDSFLR